MKHVVHVITSLTDGGAQRLLLDFCVRTKDRYRHSVISLTPGGHFAPHFAAQGLAIHSLDMARGALDPRALLRLHRLLDQDTPDVVFTWTYHANLLGGLVAALSTRARIVWSIHNSYSSHASRSSRIVALLCSPLSYLVPDAVISVSRVGTENHTRLGYSRRNLLTVPNGYDTAAFAPDANPAVGTGAALRKELGLDGRVPVLGMVSRWDPQKDHANLLGALSRLRDQGQDFVCLLVGGEIHEGNPELMANLQKLGLGDRVRLLGLRRDVGAIMNALDIHVLSSAAEAFPNVLCEAMACGIPCVSTQVGDAADIVGDTGWMVPSRDPDRLAEALRQALSELPNGPAWEARRAACRARIVNQFSLERMVETYGQILDGTSPV